MTLATLSQQLNDFLVLKKGLLESRENKLKQHPNAPLWWQLNPTHFYFSDSRKFNFNALSFLFSENPQIFNQLAVAEIKYYDMASLIERHTEAAQEMQKVFDDVGVPPGQAFEFEVVEAALGPALIGKLNTFVGGILSRLWEDEAAYKNAISELMASLIKLYSEKEISYIRALNHEDR